MRFALPFGYLVSDPEVHAGRIVVHDGVDEPQAIPSVVDVEIRDGEDGLGTPRWVSAEDRPEILPHVVRGLAALIERTARGLPE